MQCQTIALGTLQEREFGPLSVSTVVSQTHSQVTVSLSLDGQSVGRQTLDTDHLNYSFDVQSGGSKAKGTLSLAIEKSPLYSALKGGLTAQQGRGPPVAFNGDVESWQWPDTLIYSEKTFIIAAGLSAVTTVRSFERSYASVTLLSSTLPLGQLTMTPTAPTAVLMTNLQLGDVIVFKGTTFHLTPPQGSSSGQMFMQGEFQANNIPRTSIAQVIASWPSPGSSPSPSALQDTFDE